MNREFLDLYNQELQYLQDAATDFAKEYPGVADRLGGLSEDQVDPAIGGLLEGAAFLAARVQLKIRHEFPEFTSNLLDLLLPTYLAPIPSALMAKVDAPFDDPNLRRGIRIAPGSRLDATFLERETRISCQYTLIGGIELWPIEITAAEYLPGPGPIQALGIEVGPDVAAGLRLELTFRVPEAKPASANAEKKPPTPLSLLPVDTLPVHLVGAMADRLGIYEQLFRHSTRMFVHHLDSFGDNKHFEIPRETLEQIGFGPRDALVDHAFRRFEGYQLLWDYFVFRDRFLGFRLSGLKKVLERVDAQTASLVICMKQSSARLGPVVTKDNFALYCSPAVNLFEKTLDRIPVKSHLHEYPVVPDRSNYLNFEPYQLKQVYAHYQGAGTKVPVLPLYSASADAGVQQSGLRYTLRRTPRRRNEAERRFGSPSTYIGTDMFLSLCEPRTVDSGDPPVELSATAICSNRHLTEHLPVGEGGADFRLIDNVALEVRCVAGPTRPLEPIVSYHHEKTGAQWTGSVAWRLINILGRNHLGLTGRAGGKNAAALKEILRLFAGVDSGAVDNAVRGLKAVDSRPVMRRIERDDGVGIGRGMEVSIRIDENAFDRSEAFLFGAILERFLAEYASINTFTQTVFQGDAGVLMRWPPRVGARGRL